jgi:trehalose/maltose hydrolase-like predicted phosphorylase
MLHHERLRPPSHVYPADEWSVVEEAFHPEFLAQLESMLALGNGYLGMRGCPEEGGPNAENGTFINGSMKRGRSSTEKKLMVLQKLVRRSATRPTAKSSNCSSMTSLSGCPMRMRNCDFYDPLTTGDSSLSSCVEAIIAAQTGDMDQAIRYGMAALLMDLANVGGNVKDGCPIASMGGTWMMLTYGYVGRNGHSIGMETFGASAPLKELQKKFGFTLDNIVAAAKLQIAKAR